MPLLDLSNADTSGFGAIPGGTYHAEIFSIKQEGTKGGPDAKLPAGTPKINVMFKITGQGDEVGEDFQYYNRRVFSQYILGPYPKGYDASKVAVMKGSLVKFLMAAGFTNEELTSGEFDIADWDELSGRPVRVSVKKKVKYGVDPDDEGFDENDAENYDNEVTGVKAPTSASLGSSLT